MARNGKVLVMLKSILLIVGCMIWSHEFMLHMLLLLAQILDGVDTSEVNTFIPFVDGSNPRWSELVVR